MCGWVVDCGFLERRQTRKMSGSETRIMRDCDFKEKKWGNMVAHKSRDK